jgi:GntR family transcriptional regulator
LTIRIKIDRNISVPAYQQVADYIKSQILEGKLAAGGRLPPESELMDGSKLSRVTIRKGLETLENEGLVERKQGLGTFVRHPISQELSRVQTITEVLLSKGITPRVKVISFETVQPPEVVSRALLLRENQKLLLAKRLYLNEDDPVALLHIFLPLSIRKEAEVLRSEAFSTETTYTIWERAGIPIAQAAHSIRAARADKEDAKALGIKRDDPVLILDRVTYAKDGRPLEFVMYHYHWQRYEFSVAVPRINSMTS